LRILRQTTHLMALLLSNHRARPRDGILVCLGFIIAAATLSVILAIPSGIDRIIGNTGQRDIVIAVTGDSGEAGSQLSQEQITILAQLPQVVRNSDGRPLAAPQFVANTRLLRADGTPATIMLRGITPAIWELLETAQIHVDVNFREGSRQVLASKPLTDQFETLRQPSFRMRGREWQLVGTLDVAGSLLESELWVDISALQAAYNRPSSTSSLWLKLTSPAAIWEMRKEIEADPRLSGVWVRDQVDYYQSRTGNISHFTHLMAAGVSVLLGLGACLVISGMLGIALHNRRQQMATLRSLGFDRWAVILASLLDVLVIGIISSLITAGLAWWLLDGVSFGAANYQQAVYAYFIVDFKVVALVMAYALILGVVSSILPLRKSMQGRLVAVLQE